MSMTIVNYPLVIFTFAFITCWLSALLGALCRAKLRPLEEDEREDFSRIHCAILVERASQKKIVIGKGAARLKEIGINARADIEHLLGHRVHLELFVKVEEEWRNKQGLLDDMGIRGN